ncbi:signal peptidase I [Polycladomyces abyssicola]|jgi:signal peptidase I|uniref:Signal peptidase I n=1 Tax=Polycladomyces abyssicola TaxID=1125966 RepID=A0A8D5ZNN9_9BACL|nr:signal peptidase I [Polycladomyces abyssicola]BCU82142.1 signal peptidase I [Polycladomyces abyssicola]
MNQLPSRSARHKRRGKNEAWEWLQALVIAVVLALIIRYFIFEPFNVSGPSMMNTLHDGDFVLVNKLVYQYRMPKRGEVIVFEAPGHKDYIKRVIAVENDYIEAQNNVVRVNGRSINEPYVATRTDDIKLQKVPKGYVFVMGDNRMNSSDSRELGPIPVDKIVGRADIVFWPLNDFRVLW